MVELLSLLSSSGLAWILVYGKILNPFRPKWEVLKCIACTGFHTGWFVYLIFWFHEIDIMLISLLPGMFLFACASTISSWILGMLGIILEEKAYGN